MDELLLTPKDNISYSYGLLTETKTETLFLSQTYRIGKILSHLKQSQIIQRKTDRHPTPAINSNVDEPGGVALEIVSCQTAANPGIFIIKPLSQCHEFELR